jgi:hypothetical protein
VFCHTALLQFPQELEEQVARVIHHSMLPLEPLVTKIYDALRPAKPEEAAAAAAAAAAEGPAAAPDAAGEGKPSTAEAAEGAGATTVAGAAPEASPLAEKENEAQQAQQQGAGAGAGAAAAAAGAEKGAKKPKAPKAPVARSVLRTFVVEHAEQQGPEGGKVQVCRLSFQYLCSCQ